ncbi:uncharacterized protein LOC134194466 isoform X2 [Corticium candelabrum]|uniref:uncharacterized protein LOC134194466 isoform X2 n=1 Tax=Corticium candelabrum TaxID=121492 RepID=UPI002E25FE92|nr:uncharacterized protein LOC134194466 isoform X2 [Corticium candelabrum]
MRVWTRGIRREDQQRLQYEVTSQAKVQMLLMEILPYHLPWWSTFETFCDVLAGTEGQRDILERYICPPGLRLKTRGAAVPQAEQDRIISERDISEVSSRIAGSWDKVASSLDPALDSHDIRNVREDLLMKNDEKMADLLRKWVNKYSHLATIGRLRRALEKVGERKVADDSGLGVVAHDTSTPVSEDLPPIQSGDRIITLDDIFDVAKRIAFFWEEVAVKLTPRVGDDVIRNARENRFINNQGRMKEVLETWKDQYSNDATLGRLMNAVNVVEVSLQHHTGTTQHQQLSDLSGDRKITERDINDVSVSAASNWKTVASKLNPPVGEDIIQKARQDQYLSPIGRMKFVLKNWCDQNPNEATVSRLTQAVELAEQSVWQPAQTDQAGSTSVPFVREPGVKVSVQVQERDDGVPFGASRHFVIGGTGGTHTMETNGRDVISDDDMQAVCKDYGNQWEKVAQFLQPKVDAALIEKMKRNPFQNGPAILYEVLKLWSEKHHSAASLAQVKKALRDSGLME